MDVRCLWLRFLKVRVRTLHRALFVEAEMTARDIQASGVARSIRHRAEVHVKERCSQLDVV